MAAWTRLFEIRLCSNQAQNLVFLSPLYSVTFEYEEWRAKEAGIA